MYCIFVFIFQFILLCTGNFSIHLLFQHLLAEFYMYVYTYVLYVFVFIFQFIFLCTEIIRYIDGNFSFSVLLSKFTEFFQYLELKVIGSIPGKHTFSNWPTGNRNTSVQMYLHYLALKIPAIFAEKLHWNVSVSRLWELAHNVYLPKR